MPDRLRRGRRDAGRGRQWSSRRPAARHAETVKDFRRVLDRKDIDVVDRGHARPLARPADDHGLPGRQGRLRARSRWRRASAKAGRCSTAAQQAQPRRADGHAVAQQPALRARRSSSFSSGKLGKIRLVRCWAYLDWIRERRQARRTARPPAGVDYDMWLGPAPKRPFNPNRFHFNFRWFWDYAGGLMTDWGVHLINIALWGMKVGMPRARFLDRRQVRLRRHLRNARHADCTLYEFPTSPWSGSIRRAPAATASTAASTASRSTAPRAR